MIVIEVGHIPHLNIDHEIDPDLQEEDIQGLLLRGITDKDQDLQDTVKDQDHQGKDHLIDVLDLHQGNNIDVDLHQDTHLDIVHLIVNTVIDHILINIGNVVE